MKKSDLVRNRQIVTIAYYTILNRKPDEAGLAHWTTLLNKGDIDELDLYEMMFNSAEYQRSLEKEKDGVKK